jgi:hypothetical protein
MGILDELFRRKPEDEFLPEYARPADPLRHLRDAIPENKDGGLSMLNMIRSALGTSANWLDGTKDPSAVQDQDMIAPLGLGGMGGMGVMNAMTRAAPDVRIAEALGKQHPGAVPGGELHRGRIAGNSRVWVDGPDGTTPASVGRIQPAGEVGAGTMPTRPRHAANDIFADNAKGSAPGLAANSTQQPKDASQLSEPMLMELLRKLEEGA